MTRVRLSLALLLAVLLAPPLPAADRAVAPEKTPQPEWVAAPEAGGQLARLGVGTVVVLGLCVATLYAGQRWLRGGPAAAEGKQFQVLETLALGNRCSVLLVRAAGRQLLVGLDGSGVKSLLTLPEPLPDADAEDWLDPWASP